MSQVLVWKNSTNLHPIYKIAKFLIASAHPTNFQSFQIPTSGTLYTIRIVEKNEDLYLHYAIGQPPPRGDESSYQYG
jgi:hypothetical protein